MDYFLTEEQQAIVDTAREIAQKKIKPVREHYDVTEEYPWPIVEEMRKAGAALLITTHHLDEARRCDRLVLLRDGLVIAEGTTAELLERAACESIEEAFLWFARRRES